MIFFCSIMLLTLLPIHGRSITGSDVNANDHTVETSIEQVLPRGMNSHSYGKLILEYWTSERMASAQPIESIDGTD